MPAIKGTASNPLNGLEECEVCGVVGLGDICPDCNKICELPDAEIWDDGLPAYLQVYNVYPSDSIYDNFTFDWDFLPW